MTSSNRRGILKGIATIAGTAWVSGAAKSANAPPQHCPDCGTDLANGDLHWPGCRWNGSMLPADSAIDPKSIKLAQSGSNVKGPKGGCSQQNPATDPCIGPNCDRCKVQWGKASRSKGKAMCYHKNSCGCAIYVPC